MMNEQDFGDPRSRSTRRSSRWAALATALAAVLAFGTPTLSVAPAQAAKASSARSATAMAPDVYEARVQRWVNKRRAAHGLNRVRMSGCADRSAERWSRHLAARNAFYHQSMSAVLDRCNARYAGETLGRGSMWPRKLVRMWMHSPGHRAILLSGKAKRIGVGATRDGRGWVVAANFVRY
jgi:uncharacterized protein YkwD